MVDIRPFKGFGYNPKKVNLSSVVSPPYDVISPAQQEIYYNQDEHNIIRVILGKEYEGDSRINNKYTRARNYIDKWIQDGAIQASDGKGIYVYRQTFSVNDKTYAITGIVTLVRLEEMGKGNILPHEETLFAPKLDRFNLMDTCKGNLEFIYSLYSDETCAINEMLTQTIDNLEPCLDFKDEKGINQQMWQITDDSLIAQITGVMKDKPVFIADGHHRYEATFKLKTERSIRDPKPGDKPYDYIMMLLVDMNDPGLMILPTYRLVKGVPNTSTGLLLEQLKDSFDVSQSLKDEMFAAIEGEQYSFGMYIQGNFYLLRLKDGVADKQLMPGKSAEYQSLDVVVLHSLVIDNLYGDCFEEGNIAYVKDTEAAIASVDTGEYQLALFLAPARLSQLKTLSLNHEKMPQKSTYFWPKPVSGLLLYLWE